MPEILTSSADGSIVPRRPFRRRARVALTGLAGLFGALILLPSCRYHTAPPPAPPEAAAPPRPPSSEPPSAPASSSLFPDSALFALPGGDPAAQTPAGARERLRERVRRSPNDIQARIQLAATLDSQGDASEAEDVLRAALQRGQRAPEIYHALGMLYLRHNQFRGAADAFLIETKLNPKSVQGHIKLATAYSYIGRSAEAMQAFETARKLDPNNPDVYMGLAFLNNTSERYPYAVQYLNEYIQRATQPGPGYALLSRVYLNMRQYEKAVEAGEKAVEAMPGNASVWYNLGQAYSYRPGGQDLDRAAHAFERAVQLAPDHGHAHFELGRVYSRQKRFGEAIQHYREATRHEPLQGKYFYQLGRLLMQQGEREEGQKAIQRSQFLIPLNQREEQLLDKITANPRDPRNIFELGQVYKKMGNYVRAKSSFETVLDLSPRYPRVKEELAEVQRLASVAPSAP